MGSHRSQGVVSWKIPTLVAFDVLEGVLLDVAGSVNIEGLADGGVFGVEPGVAGCAAT